jgi:hypothetical protein
MVSIKIRMLLRLRSRLLTASSRDEVPSQSKRNWPPNTVPFLHTTTLENSANLSSQNVAVVSNSGNQAQIKFSLNGLRQTPFSRPGGGHAHVVAAFNILRHEPVAEVSTK